MIDSNIPKRPAVLAVAGLAVALLLGFALNPTPAFAKGCGGPHFGEPGCDGGSSEETFSVFVEKDHALDPGNWVVIAMDDTDCLGIANLPGLGASFPFANEAFDGREGRGCGKIGAAVPGDVLYLFVIGVKDTKKGAMQLWFTTHDFSDGKRIPSETVYQSRDRLAATIILEKGVIDKIKSGRGG